VKAITIKQPYPSLIMAGIKTVETRTRDTKIRGRILIHSAAVFHRFSWHFFNEDEQKHILPLFEKCDEHPAICYGALPLGVILGSVEIVDTMPAGVYTERYGSKGTLTEMEMHQREWALGDLSTDRWAWILANPEPWPEPAPFKGKQGFWNHPGSYIKRF
jgi:hypothetical protein